MTQPLLTNEAFVFALEASASGMLLVDEVGTLLKVNRHVEGMFGFTRSELEGQSIERLVPLELRGSQTALRGCELLGRRKDGREIAVEVALHPLRTPEGNFVLGTLIEVNKDLAEEVRVRTARLSATLAESESRLREIQHRVKNNLQILFSLINMQRRRYAGGPESAPLEQCQSRVGAIALAYDGLSHSRDPSRVPFGSYAQSLCRNLLGMSEGPARARVGFEYAIDATSLDLDQAVPCGLILNELVRNALEHAFPNGRAGKIRIGMMTRADGKVVLSVADDGVGMPPGLDVRAAPSLGLALVEMLVEQLHGTFCLAREPGTAFQVVFAGEA